MLLIFSSHTHVGDYHVRVSQHMQCISMDMQFTVCPFLGSGCAMHKHLEHAIFCWDKQVSVLCSPVSSIDFCLILL